MADFTGTVTTATPITEVMPKGATDNHVQITSKGANSLQVETLETGQTAFTIQIAAMSEETLIIDMIDVQQVRLTATGGDVGYTLTGYRT